MSGSQLAWLIYFSGAATMAIWEVVTLKLNENYREKFVKRALSVPGKWRPLTAGLMLLVVAIFWPYTMINRTFPKRSKR